MEEPDDEGPELREDNRYNWLDSATNSIVHSMYMSATTALDSARRQSRQTSQ